MRMCCSICKDTSLIRSTTCGLCSICRALHTSGFCQVHLAICERGWALWELKRKYTTAEGGSHDEVIRTLITDIELSWNLDGTFKHHRASPHLICEMYEVYTNCTKKRVLETSSNLPASQLNLLYRHVARRPFITSRGHLGLGPVDMLPGGRVVVLSGSTCPSSKQRRLLPSHWRNIRS